MTSSFSRQAQISRLILKHRWLLMLLAALIALLFETAEHTSTHAHLGGHFYRELLMFVVIYPAAFGMSLTLLARTELERLRVSRHLSLEHDLIEQMSSAGDWEELSSVLVEFPSQVAPFDGASLHLYDPPEGNLEPVVEWKNQEARGTMRETRLAIDNMDVCLSCLKSRTLHQVSAGLCSNVNVVEGYQGFCLPLVHGNQAVATLFMFLPDNLGLSEDQIELLNNVAPSMAFAIDGTHPLGSGIIRESATEAERRRLARHLHDTLGQSLGFLVLKLDHLKGEDVLGEIAAVRQELAQMHNVANQAYERVRSTLTTLHEKRVADLFKTLRELAKSVGDRADIKVTVNSKGEPCPLPQNVQFKIISIFREAMINVQKHAQATKMDLHLQWARESLKITLVDNGTGITTSNHTNANGHYGLVIMQERAEEIDGRLSFDTVAGGGTKVSLQVPLYPYR